MPLSLVFIVQPSTSATLNGKTARDSSSVLPTHNVPTLDALSGENFQVGKLPNKKLNDHGSTSNSKTDGITELKEKHFPNKYINDEEK